jgi:hypothetical protein
MTLEPSRIRADDGRVGIGMRLAAIKRVLLMDEKEAFGRLFVAEVRLFRRFALAMHLLALAIMGGSVYYMWVFLSPVYASVICAVAVVYGAALEILVRRRRRQS